MSGILLDTHVLLWLVSDPDRIAVSAREILHDSVNDLYVSASSAWEIAIKTRLGRLDGSALLSTWNETLVAMSVIELAITSTDATMAGQLTWDHRDPFDRMMVAQATRRRLTIATSDRTILALTPTPVMDTR